MKSLTKNALFNALYQVLNMIFPLISSVYVARTLMPGGVGRVAYAQNVASYFAAAAALGIPAVGLRVISGARDDRRMLDQSFSELVVLNAASTGIALALYLVLIFCHPAFRADIRLYLAAGLVVAFNFINIDWLFQGFEEYGYIVLRSILVKILSLFALFAFVRRREDYVIYAAVTGFAVCGNYLFNAFRAGKYAALRFRGLDLRRHVRPVLLLAGSLFFAAIYGKVDTTMLGVLSGGESVGYYSYAHKVLQIGVSFCAAVTSAFLPRLSYCYDRDRAQFRLLVTRGVRIVSFLSIPAAVGLLILAPEAITLLFGGAFLPAARTLRIFSVLIVVFAFGNLLCYQMMICSGSEKKHVMVLACAAGINIALNAVLIPKLQQDGAAIASVCTEVFINLLEGVYFTKMLGLRHEWTAIGQAALSSAAMGASMLLMKRQMDGSLLPFLLCIIVGGGVYIGANVLMKNRLTMEVITSVRGRLHRAG